MAPPLIGAIEAGGTKIVAAVAARDGTILDQCRIPTGTGAETMAEVCDFLARAARPHGQLRAVGLASFGPLDIAPGSPSYGTITTTPKPGWSGFNLITALAPLGVPVLVDTDVNAAARGEWLKGAGRGCETLAYTTVGTGIGTGVLHAGNPLAGFSHFESGHIRVPHDPTRDPFAGTCPYHGDCLEGLASGRAIAARFGTSLSQLPAPDAAITLVADYLADLAVNLVLLHAPDRLIFGGGVMKTPGLLVALRRATEARLAGYIAHPRLDPGLESYIQAPELGDLAGITGAIALGRQPIAQSDNGA